MSRSSLKLKGLSLDRLETLAGIIARGGIARAADGDGNRQSLFSRQVAELEAWFGFPLLDRSVSPNRATAAAERIAACTEGFLREIEAIREEAGERRRTVVFGAGERMLRSYLIPLTARLPPKDLRLVFRNLTSRATRAELVANRVDFGVVRREHLPAGMAHIELPALAMCLLIPPDQQGKGRKWDWRSLAREPLAVLEGDGRLARFLADKARETGVQLDVAVACSTWTQVIDAMRTHKLAGILPKDLEKEFPPNFRVVALPELVGYADEYVLAWSAAAAAKRDEIARVAAVLQGRKPCRAGGAANLGT